MSAMQHVPAASFPRPLQLPKSPTPARAKKAAPVKTKGAIVDRKANKDESPRSAFNPFAGAFAALPNAYSKDVCPQLTKGENDIMLTVIRLSWGQTKTKGELKRETDHLTKTQLADEAGVDRRTADFVVELLLGFGLLGRGDKKGTRYRFWARAENWAGWKRPEIASESPQDDDDEDDNEEVPGEETEKEIGGRQPISSSQPASQEGNQIPLFGSRLVVKRGEQPRSVRFEPAVRERVQELYYRTSCQAPLSIEHAIEGGKLIVSIRDLEAKVQQSAASSEPVSRPKPHSSEVKEVRLLLNSLLYDQDLMERASDVLCNQVLHLRGRATINDLRLKIAGRAKVLSTKKDGFVTPGLVITWVKECAEAAESAYQQNRADEAVLNIRQRKANEARDAREALDREYLEGDDEHRAKMREEGYRF